MTDAAINKLFERTLLGEYDDDGAWDAVRALWHIGSRGVFERAAEWCTATDLLRRARGADILAQIGKTAEHPTTLYAEESFPILVAMSAGEPEWQPLSSAIAALGHLENPAAIPLLCQHSHHTNEAVRFHVACALGCFPNDENGAATMLELMSDTDSDVRDWATFGLGVLGDLDTPRIREALFLNLSDSDNDVREEAMAGLAKRHDLRVLQPLLAELSAGDPSVCLIEAAESLLDGLDLDQLNVDEIAAALHTKYAEHLR